MNILCLYKKLKCFYSRGRRKGSNVMFNRNGALISMIKCIIKANDDPDKLLHFLIIESIKLIVKTLSIGI